MVDKTNILDPEEVVKKIGKVRSFDNLTPAKLKSFSEAIAAVNDFNKNVSAYSEHILKKGNIFKTIWRFYWTPKLSKSISNINELFVKN